MNQHFVILELSKANDSSPDSTSKVAKKIHNSCFNLRLLKRHGKESKLKSIALKKFVIRTKSDRISLKDADCESAFKFCLQKINTCISKKLNFFLGYSPYGYNTIFLNEFIKWETLKTEIYGRHQTLSNKAHSCGNRAVMYEESISLESKNFKNKINLTFWDSDIRLQNAKGETKINLNITPKSFALDHSKKSCILWWKQKYSITSPFYYKLNQLFIQDYYFSQFLFWSTFFILLSRKSMMALLIFRIAIAAKSLIAAEFQKAFKVPKSILWIWPNFEENLLILQMGIGINRIFQKT